MVELGTMDTLSAVISEFFNPTSVWSVVFRGVIWFIIAAVIIVSVDSPNPTKSFRKMKSNLGFSILFIVVSSALMYLLFGYAQTS